MGECEERRREEDRWWKDSDVKNGKHEWIEERDTRRKHMDRRREKKTTTSQQGEKTNGRKTCIVIVGLLDTQTGRTGHKQITGKVQRKKRAWA